MLNKAVFLACLAFTLAAPAVEERTTTVVRGSPQGHEDVQRLIEELERGHTPAKKDTVVKKTTITTIEEPIEETLSDDEQLKEFMKDPKFEKELKAFLLEFLKMYNSLNKVQKDSSSSPKLINEETADVQALLRSPSFFSFLSSFFKNNNNQQGGLSGFFSQLFEQNKSPPTTSTHTITEELVNGHSRPLVVEHPTPQVTITHLETSEVPVSSDSGANAAEAILDKLTGSPPSPQVYHNERPHKTTTTTVIEETSDGGNTDVGDRFGGDSHVTITHVGNDGHENIFHENNVVSTSEDLLNQLKRQNSYDSVRHDSIVNPTVIVHKVPTTSNSHLEDWSEVHAPKYNENSAEFLQQAKNANYQYATQIDDHINGNYQQKAEVRQGGAVYGKYSYDDGFFWRTVYYQADKNGFVVTKEEVLPTHMAQLTGEASVQTLMDGNLVDYHITERDIGGSRKHSNALFQ